MNIEFFTVILSFIIGSIPFGYIFGILLKNTDIRNQGSGNIGTTNSFRVFGKINGFLTLILDILKGFLGASLPLIFHSEQNLLYVGVFAVLGHMFSPWLKFKGGKGVATSAGILIPYNLNLFLLSALVLIIVLFISSMMSIASISTFFFVMIVAIVCQQLDLEFASLFLTFLTIYKHISNIKAIFLKKERLVPFGIYYKLKRK